MTKSVTEKLKRLDGNDVPVFVFPKLQDTSYGDSGQRRGKDKVFRGKRTKTLHSKILKDKELRREQTEHTEEDKTLCTGNRTKHRSDKELRTETADKDAVKTNSWILYETPHKIHPSRGEPNEGNANGKENN